MEVALASTETIQNELGKEDLRCDLFPSCIVLSYLGFCDDTCGQGLKLEIDWETHLNRPAVGSVISSFNDDGATHWLPLATKTYLTG